MLTGVTLVSLIFTFALPRLCEGRGKNTRNKPNIILIAVDALRPDHLSCYGYKRATSPNIDKLAKEGVMFTQAITAGGRTDESVASILSGTYAVIHQIKEWNMPINPSIKTLPQLLKQKGFRSALFTNHAAIDITDIKDDFDLTYIKGWEEINAHRLTIKAIDWIKKNKDKPFFMYLHYKGSHVPYRPPEPYKSRYLYDRYRIKKEIPISEDKDGKKRYDGSGKIPYVVAENNISDISYYIAQYDGAISYTDAQIAYLMDNLRQSGLLENTLIILTADHGEMLGEHNIYFSHQTCYENNIRVPLIIRYPELFSKKKIISCQVSLIDLAPMILEIAGIDIPHYIQGRSLLALFKNEKFNLHPYVYTSDRSFASIRNETWKLIRKPNLFYRLCDLLTINIRGKTWKLIREPRKLNFSYELYNLLKDPQEQYNLISKEKDKFKELKHVLETYKKEHAPFYKEKETEPLTDEQKEMLKSLGYLQ